MRPALAIALSLIAFPAWADQRAIDCQEWYDLSFDMMSDRQAGVSMPEVLAKAASLPDHQQMIGRQIALRVFEKPRHFSQIQKEMETAEFANAAFGACYGG